MDADPKARRVFRFGLFEAHLSAGELRHEGRKINLQEQPFQILALLLERPAEVVTREELQRKLWPKDTFVDFEAGLNTAIRKLREALGDSASNPRFVETLPRRGYRFIAAMGGPAAPPQTEGAVERQATRVSRRWIWGGTVAAAVLAAVVLGLNVGGLRERLWQSFRLGAPIKSLAVLPLENLTGDPAQDYFVDGMTDALITNFAQISGLRVISRTSVMQYKGAKKPLPQIARELNVEAVVEGAVLRSGERVRITAQLIHAPTDRHLWAQSYEHDLRDVLALQGEIAQAIAEAVEVKLTPRERARMARARGVHPEAYEAYLRGRFFWSQWSPEGLLKAVEYFQQAVAKDPTYAPAYSGLSDSYRLLGFGGIAPPREWAPKAEAAARKALELDPELAEAHASLAGFLYRYRWDWQRAEKEFKRSLELDANYAEGHRAYAIYLGSLGRREEALSEVQRAGELSPLSPVVNSEVGLALQSLGRYDEAIKQLQKTLEMYPNFAHAHAILAKVYEQKGHWPQAVAAREKAVALSRRPDYLARLGYVYAASGHRRQAQKILAELEQLSQQRYVSPRSFALIQLGLGNKEQALAWLEKGYAERSYDLLNVYAEDRLDALWSEPRFQALLRQMGLAQ